MLKNKLTFVLLAFVLLGMILLSLILRSKTLKESNSRNAIDPSNFVSSINNKHFTLNPGTKFIYENKTSEGIERIEVEVTQDSKKVIGVEATVVLDRVYLNDKLIEETYDWYAQDNQGNVWYFGEDVSNFADGKLINKNGSWEAGVDGAEPGIIMLANPTIGKSYRQEYYKGKAEDMGEVVALDKKVVVPYGVFEGCLQTRDWNNLEPGLNEYKYYCPAVGFVVLEESVTGGQEKVELVNISSQ